MRERVARLVTDGSAPYWIGTFHATGLRILQAKRREFFGDDRPFEVTPKHIQVAEQKFGLGVADPKRIEVVKLGLSEGALI